ncbi:tetratricopeptide repeat protein [Cellvibrio sp.]|uniref:tetratricopeptide repeat protein n=1 Tax=Cellvibrio sp. TaxID=1965322 RepID=UPI003964762A
MNKIYDYGVKKKNMELKDYFKRLLIIFSLAVGLSAVGCSDKKGVDKEAAARHVTSAATYFGQGQFHAAMLEARNAVQNDPNNANGFVMLGKIYNALGSFDSAQKTLEPIQKKLPEVSLDLAESYLNNNKYRSVINVLSSYVPESSQPEQIIRRLTYLCQSYVRLGDKQAYEKSLAELKKLPNNENDVLVIESEYLISQGQKEAAAAKLDLLAKSNNLNAKTYLLLGNFALQNNEQAKAEDFFTKALGLLPNTDVMTLERRIVLTQLTEVLILQGRTSEAYRYQKILADANPEGKAAQQKYSDAMELYRQGKFSDAEKLLEEIRDQFPQDKNSAMLLGLVQFQRGQDEQAIELFDKYIDTETASSTLIQTAALAKFRVKRTDEAIDMLKKAVEGQPNNADILATYGLALLDVDPTSDEGQKALEKSLAISPEKHRLRLALAKRHYAMKNDEQGLAQLRTAYRAAPIDFVVQESYFKALMQAGKNEELKSEIANFQKDNPGSGRSAFIEGWYKLVIKDYVGAQVAFEKALSVKDNNERVMAFTGLAELYQMQNQPQKAINTWQTLLKEDPTQIPVYAKWYALMRELKRTPEAVSFLTDLDAKADKWQPSAVLAQILQEQQQTSEAVKYIEHALERSGRAENVKQLAANMYHTNGLQLLAQNKPAEAKTSMLKALNFFPENPQYLSSLIQLEINQKNIPEAQKLLDQFARTAENEYVRLYLQGVIRFAEDKKEEGLDLYRKSWALQPSELVGEMLLNYYDKNQQKAEAIAHLNDWSKKLPKSYRAALLQAVNAQNDKKADEAMKWYEKAIEIEPNSPIALNNLAWMYYERKNSRAIELAKKAAQLAPNSGEVLDTYGWILVENGQIAEGVEVLERAAALAKDNKEIAEHLKAAKVKK